ncbi:uncharacterized protein LOC135091061 isoform X1 [Scylla paramamosain]|uniref:uncharacterized protein LOC135091061 isoform X1 n=1 Tax=Scylla paramamosain TaxID=85552 RepID=UPI0030828557
MGVLGGVLLLFLAGAVPSVTAEGTPVVEVLYNTSGIIEAPEDPSGNNWYQPDARYLWILDMQRANVNIEVTVEKLDLGLPYNAIHEASTKINFTAGDFVLVGAGSDVLQGNELMFFGTRSTPRKIIVRSGVGHIFFYSTQTITDAKGFTISYSVTDMASTLPPPTTPTPAPPVLSSAFISIKGIPVDDWMSYNDKFKLAISNMASDYDHKDLNMTKVPVDPSEVIINEAKKCHPDFCPVDLCVTYDFSIATETEGEVVFSKKDLEGMINMPSANQYIADVFGASCEICDDEASISTLLYIMIPLGVVIFGVAITYTAWKLTGRSSFSHAQEKYEQAQRDRIEDQRRRSSGDISILGVGGRSIASQGSRSSRRYTMPFPKPARDEVDHGGIEEEREEEVDTSDFVYYDPDQGITDPAQFGLAGVVSGFARQGQESHQYTNEAFVMDEDSAIALQRTSFADDSSDTDSDNGGALSFRPKRREMTAKNQIEVPAEVHSPEVEGETAL